YYAIITSEVIKMSDIREKLITIFEDTLNWLAQNPELKQATENSIKHTKLYLEQETPKIPESQENFQTRIHVSKLKSFEMAMQLHKQYPNAKIAVHNFASATNAGGGVTHGSRAQEESLCRCSNLYPCLNQDWLKQEFYLFHRLKKDLRYTNACIYSPDILIIKTDDNFPERMPESDWCKVDILTCAAPNLRIKPYNRMNPGKGSEPLKLTDRELLKLHISRARHMFSIALANHIQVLVLGAFGCGAFCNNPFIVAQAYRQVLQEPEFKNKFQHIEFAIYHTPRKQNNYTTFQRVFEFQ
ncbi:MAG: TIGR02452 family protein, partial [Oscillospiraceae bacterium]|nr:TIGR02452 family protein [Oscillospiraceae bacterium]